MPSSLCFTVRFLQPHSHGRGDGGEPEWPPSPLRLFQSLVAAAAARWNERQRLYYAIPALNWLAQQSPPVVVASAGIASKVRTQFYVPDNTADLLVPQFKRGVVHATPKRAEKVVRPTHILDGDAVHYLYPLPDDCCLHLEVLKAAARSITHLGWGIDMVAADADVISEADAANLPGHRWRVVPNGGVPLRVPKPGTLDDLMRKHDAFLGRLSDDGFRPVPPLSCFNTARYFSSTVTSLAPSRRPIAAFRILKPDFEGYRSFNPQRGTSTVAHWFRMATGAACKDWPFEQQDPVEAFVYGHAGKNQPIKGPRADRRFMFLPLPTINAALGRVEAIRRVLLVAPPGCEPQLDYARKRLAGAELKSATESVGILNHLPHSDWVLRQYLEPASAWTSVTPVVLPGHDDRHIAKAEDLIRKSFMQAGFAPEIAECCTIDFRKVGFLPGVDLADRYALPAHPPVKGPRYHVQVCFPHAVPGPIAMGALRYRGFGLMVGRT